MTKEVARIALGEVTNDQRRVPLPFGTASIDSYSYTNHFKLTRY